MKTKNLICLFFFLSTTLCFSQTGENLNEQNISLLNGVSFKYTYENGSAIKIDFNKKMLNYKWIEGPNKDKPAKTYPYKIRLISENNYYINWHEADNKNFITLVFDLNKMEAFSSVIVKYKNDKPYTTFDKALISDFKENLKNKTLPYAQIPTNTIRYYSGNIIKRMVDGLGYRYYWATEGLTAKDLEYRPSENARNTRQTLEHLYGLSETILNASQNQPIIRPKNWSDIPFIELRKMTLESLNKASMFYENKNSDEISNLKVVFEVNSKKSEFPFWNMINGPISDALYHTGQIVSFRRSSGNPINPKVNVFLGKTEN